MNSNAVVLCAGRWRVFCLKLAVKSFKNLLQPLEKIFSRFTALKPRDSSVGRAVDCRGNCHPSVTGSIPVREILLFCARKKTQRMCISLH